jgi:hypothetical protein
MENSKSLKTSLTFYTLKIQHHSIINTLSTLLTFKYPQALMDSKIIFIHKVPSGLQQPLTTIYSKVPSGQVSKRNVCKCKQIE